MLLMRISFPRWTWLVSPRAVISQKPLITIIRTVIAEIILRMKLMTSTIKAAIGLVLLIYFWFCPSAFKYLVTLKLSVTSDAKMGLAGIKLKIKMPLKIRIQILAQNFCMLVD